MTEIQKFDNYMRILQLETNLFILKTRLKNKKISLTRYKECSNSLHKELRKYKLKKLYE
jgi:hypothetical protein